MLCELELCQVTVCGSQSCMERAGGPLQLGGAAEGQGGMDR